MCITFFFFSFCWEILVEYFTQKKCQFKVAIIITFSFFIQKKKSILIVQSLKIKSKKKEKKAEMEVEKEKK